MLLVQVAGLGGTGYVIWRVSVAPRLRYSSPAEVIAGAVGYALLAWVWSALLVVALSAVVARHEGRNALGRALRTSRTAVWFAPACILLSQLSPAAVIPAVALVVGATQLLYSGWVATQPAGATPVFIAPGPFELLPSPWAVRALAPALTVSVGLEAGFVAVTAGYPLAAAFLFCGTAAMLTILLLASGLMAANRDTSLSRSFLGAALTVILAAGLTTVHGIARLNRGHSYGTGDPAVAARGPLDSTRKLVKNLFDKESGGDDDDDDVVDPTRLYSGPANVDLSDNVFPGVVLWPEVKPYAILVAPAPAWTRSPLAAFAERPYSIPFDGEYWMYKPPQTRPPRDAYRQRGTPLAYFYRTTDHRRMAMEARQKLPHPISIDCCRDIQMAVYNADRNPGTITLELSLADSRTRPRVSVSLGRQPVTRWPKLVRGQERVAPVFEILDFYVPRMAPVREFDELRVVIHRDPVRADKSARLSIERFILVPRSL